MILVLSALAFAGKLQDGWRGIPYGPDTVLATPPTEHCLPETEGGVRWTCDETVGAAKVKVFYMVAEGLYGGVMIQCAEFAACTILFDTVTAAWAVPFAKKNEYDRGILPDGFFNLQAGRAGVVASWSYNGYSDTGSLSVMNLSIAAAQGAAEKRRAAAAAESL